MNQTEGRVALVTGASGDIGRAIARELAQNGVAVALHYHRNREGAQKAVSGLPGARHHLIQADLGSAEQAAAAVEEVVRVLGRLDILVNNAGGGFEEHPPLAVRYDAWQEVWNRTLKLDLLAPVWLTFCAVRKMSAQGGGRVISISSRDASRGEPSAPAHGAAKAALKSFSQSMAQALAPQRILSFTVAPGWVETAPNADFLSTPSGEQVRRESPLGRVARPEEIATVVRFLALEAPEYLTGGIFDLNGASYLRG